MIGRQIQYHATMCLVLSKNYSDTFRKLFCMLFSYLHGNYLLTFQEVNCSLRIKVKIRIDRREYRSRNRIEGVEKAKFRK